MSILTWLFQLCHILIIKVVTICLLPSIHILIPNISRIELHIYLTKLFLPVNIILVHLCDTAHASIAVSIYISQRIGNYGKKSSSAAVIRIEGYEQVTDFVYKILPDFYITAETADLQVLSYMFSVCY